MLRRPAIALLVLLAGVRPALADARAAGAKLDRRLQRVVAASPARGRPAPRWERDGRLHVYVRLAGSDASTPAALAAAGLAVERSAPALRLVQGWIAAGRLDALAALPGVASIRPVDLARPRITSEGDLAARADLVRALGWDGTGVTVGVISTGADGVAASQAVGELPAVAMPCGAGAGDEGTAMLEIIHDLAPGATLLFAGVGTSLEFMDALACLAGAGARVLVDDLGFFEEPYFEDGPVADAVREIIAAGLVYVSAAGNEALEHHELEFKTGNACIDLHNFRGRDPAACRSGVTVAPFEVVDCILQWNDQFGVAGNNYDLFLVDESLAVLEAGDDVQAGQGDPIEFASWFNPGPDSRTIGVQIRKTNGAARLLELFCLGGALEFALPYGSVFGHPALPEALAVGAVSHDLPTVVELFSSWGPARLFFPAAMRPKPDMVAFDGVLTAVPGFAPFFGTSAAAPHVAAAAALLLAKNPFLTPAEVQGALVGGAITLGANVSMNAAGAGRLDALAAADRVPTPACRARADCDPGCPIDACAGGTCTHSTVDGSAPPCMGLVPRAVGKRFTRACQAAVRAAAVPGTRRETKLRRRADRLLARAGKAARRSASAACTAALETSLAAARSVLGPLDGGSAP